MRLCAACCEGQPRERFSHTQWKLKQHQRRCKDCIDANRDVQLKPNPQPAVQETVDAGASCWICLDKGPDDAGHPLRRDCSCRGDDAGYAHLSCIVKYAQEKTKAHCANPQKIRLKVGYVKPWSTCPCCLQPYCNQLLADLAMEFVDYCKKGDCPDMLHLLALEHKLRVFHIYVKEKPQTIEEDTANEILMVCERMKSTKGKETQRTLALTHHTLGNIYASQSTPMRKEIAEKAIEHFERSKQISKRIGDSLNVSTTEKNIAVVKAQSPGGEEWSKEKELAMLRCEYKFLCDDRDEDSSAAIEAGLDLAKGLWDVYRNIEAERLTNRLFAMSRRVHGHNHETTKKAAKTLKALQQRFVVVDGKCYEALQYNDDGECVLRGPVSAPGVSNPDGEVIAVHPDAPFFLPGTSVAAAVFDSRQEHKIFGDVVGPSKLPFCYKVRLEKGEEICEVHQCNIRILFELPDEGSKRIVPNV